MIDLRRIVGFDWDEGNSRQSALKHAVDRGEAEQVYSNFPLLVFSDTSHSEGEPRSRLWENRSWPPIQISFTLRQAPKIRVISARPMSAGERARYGQEA
ncbi:BrnT family toxin [Rhodopseudomonas palustris]|uniref:BrnT family toxin n=1 Tax=Rhodopseudomonas palustris TaxID=1076 RepID=A0A418VG24_RHOPL|nr:BrnT family toxin [Rhodopseudomonas palustris]RJF75075.1 BrnT family toxin [Rhodopseudomonas palustris]